MCIMICKLHAHIKMNNVHFVQDVTSLFKIGICSHLARYEKCYEVEVEYHFYLVWLLFGDSIPICSLNVFLLLV